MPSFGVKQESGTLKRVLVHHPGVELELANSNPEPYNFGQPVDIKRFKAEHRSLMKALADAGVEVLDVGTLIRDDPEMVEQAEKCPNLVFTRDTSAVTDAGAILFRMGLPSRRLETPVIKAAHEAIGVPIAFQLMDAETFEGGGLALLEGRAAVAGLCSRTTRVALEALRGFLLSERLVDLFIVVNLPPDDIHIDGDFAELPGKTAVVHETLGYSFSEFYTRSDDWRGSFVEWLRDEGWDLLEITDRERLEMAANFLTVAPDLALHYTGNPRVMEEAKKRGLEVVQIPGDEMRKGMGGIHCMTCPILRV